MTKVLLRIAQIIINVFISSRFRVEGDSMFPALGNGESVLAVRPLFSWNRLRRGDIVVIRHPQWSDRTYVKRIAGLPNEDMRVHSGSVYVGDEVLEEAYLLEALPGRADRDGKWWNGPAEYFVLGDNRSDSEDSRAFGPVGQQLILGRVWLRCWPPRAWGLVSGVTRSRD